MYEYVGKKNNNLFFTLWPLWYWGAILLAEMWGVGVRKMADVRMMRTWVVSVKLNAPRK
jgi:hypothetical protein